ncbi:MAG: glycosyltransferase family 2 protein [Oscillospiraceae bacterium]|nr:glycosyltransferase family 2 protein [Oscillospiraceae bacterium]
MRLLVIIPAYNEEESILTTVTNLRSVCPKYDYLVVNDGSADRTAAVCRENHLRLLDLPVNLGLSGAFQAGMKYAYQHGYDAAVQFDADGQHCPEYLSAMLEKLGEGYDIVIGSRFVEKKKPRSMRMLGSSLIAFAIRLTTGRWLGDPTSGMRMYNRRMIRQFATQLNIEPEPDTIAYLIQSGAKVAEVQVEMKERMAGQSYLSPIRSACYMVQMGISIILFQKFRRKMALD